eukprot:3939934-Rhodomonas_salina.1
MEIEASERQHRVFRSDSEGDIYKHTPIDLHDNQIGRSRSCPTTYQSDVSFLLSEYLNSADHLEKTLAKAKKRTWDATRSASNSARELSPQMEKNEKAPHARQTSAWSEESEPSRKVLPFSTSIFASQRNVSASAGAFCVLCFISVLYFTAGMPVARRHRSSSCFGIQR